MAKPAFGNSFNERAKFYGSFSSGFPQDESTSETRNVVEETDITVEASAETGNPKEDDFLRRVFIFHQSLLQTSGQLKFTDFLAIA